MFVSNKVAPRHHLCLQFFHMETPLGKASKNYKIVDN